MSRTSSVGKVGDSESGGTVLNLTWNIRVNYKFKSACAVGQGTLPKVGLANDHLLSLNYECGTLKDMISPLEVGIHNIHEIKVYTIYQTLSLT